MALLFRGRNKWPSVCWWKMSRTETWYIFLFQIAVVLLHCIQNQAVQGLMICSKQHIICWLRRYQKMLLWKQMTKYRLMYALNNISKRKQYSLHRPLQKRERAGKEYGCFPFVWKTKIFKWKINYILESLPQIEVFGGGKWQNNSSTNITQIREFVWIG